jgi:hypothetical protein
MKKALTVKELIAKLSTLDGSKFLTWGDEYADYFVGDVKETTLTYNVVKDGRFMEAKSFDCYEFDVAVGSNGSCDTGSVLADL